MCREQLTWEGFCVHFHILQLCIPTSEWRKHLLGSPWPLSTQLTAFIPLPFYPQVVFFKLSALTQPHWAIGWTWWATGCREPQLRPCGKNAYQVFNTIKSYLLHHEMHLGSTPNKLGQVKALKGMSVLSTEGLKLIWSGMCTLCKKGEHLHSVA